MNERRHQNAARDGRTGQEQIRDYQCPKCHAIDGNPCVEPSGRPQIANHIERVRAATSDIFNRPQTTHDVSPTALAFVGGYLLSWKRGPAAARLTAQELEVGARALNAMTSGRSFLETCHRHGRTLEEVAAQQDYPLHVIAEIYAAAVRDLALHASPLLEACCKLCLHQMPDVIFDSTLRCPGCLASLLRFDKPVPNALDVEEFKAACAALGARWTAPTFEIEAAYQKRIKLWNHMIKTTVQPGKRHPHAEDARAKDNGAWEFIKSYRAKYGN